MKKKLISLLLLLTMCFSILSVLTACGDDGDSGDGGSGNGGSGSGGSGNSTPNALVIMSDALDGVFNPFFSTSAPDGNIVAMTQMSMLTTDIDANGDVVVAFGDDEAVVVKDFEKTYNKSTDRTTYTFVIKNGIKFSDGTPLTIEDVLFNMYVYLDPVYTGSSTMYSTDIVGLLKYRLQDDSINEEDDSATDSTATEAARLVEQRIQELVDVFEDIAETNSGNYDTTKAEMLAAIDAWTVSDGYIEAVATPEEQDSLTDADYRAMLKADYEKVLAYFTEELNSNWETAPESFSEEPYKSYKNPDGSAFFDDVTSFMAIWGLVEIEYEKKDNGAPDYQRIKEIRRSGYDPATITTKEAAIAKVFEKYTNTQLNGLLLYGMAPATVSKLESEFLAKAKEVILGSQTSTGGALEVPNIEGIKSLGHTTNVQTIKVNGTDYTVAHEHNSDGTPKNAGQYDVLQVEIYGVDPKAVWNFAFSVAPQHYYAPSQTVDIKNNKFGVKFNSFDFMQNELQATETTKVPMGAGPYVATDKNDSNNPRGIDFFNANIVYFKANNNFLMGAPKINRLRYQVVSASNAIQMLQSGEVHYVTPQLTQHNEQLLASMASQGFKSLQSKQLGYGYIGINAGKIENMYVRKAIMSAMNTALAIDFYNAGTAERIYWPMSTVSWAYPKDASGKPDTNLAGYPAINFTDSAATAAINNYMEQAATKDGGYSQGDLKLTFTIAGSNLTDHPTYRVFEKAAELLNATSWGFDVEVIADSQALTKLTTGSLSVWAAAWGTTVDPDMYQVYHKNSSATSVKAWGYPEILKETDGEEYDILLNLSEVIDDARETEDRDERTELYREAMGYVLDMAIELPVYQRNELYAYNANVIKSSSLPSAEEMNPYTSPLDKIWEIEFAD